MSSMVTWSKPWAATRSRAARWSAASVFCFFCSRNPTTASTKSTVPRNWDSVPLCDSPDDSRAGLLGGLSRDEVGGVGDLDAATKRLDRSSHRGQEAVKRGGLQ